MINDARNIKYVPQGEESSVAFRVYERERGDAPPHQGEEEAKQSHFSAFVNTQQRERRMRTIGWPQCIFVGLGVERPGQRQPDALMRRPNHSLASQVNLWKPREISGISLETVSLTISDIKDTQCQRPFVVVRDTEVLVECFEYMRIPTTDWMRSGYNADHVLESL